MNNEQSYQELLNDYKNEQYKYYSSITNDNKTFNQNSPEYKNMIDTHKKLQDKTNSIIQKMKESEHNMGILDNKQQLKYEQLQLLVNELQRERDINNGMLQKYGSINNELMITNINTHSLYTVNVIWYSILVLLIILFSNFVLSPKKAINIYNIVLLSIIILLLMLSSEGLRNYSPIFFSLLPIIIILVIIMSIFKYKTDN